jgi:peptidoglycan/LPS O-acetylase OafA/YrhL
MNILPAIIIFGVAILTAWMLSLRFRAPAPAHRFTAIDGLRGYLALGVVTHHAVIWYYYLRRGELKSLPSHFYTNLGEASVALFFMITGFLFWDKLLRGRTARIDWTRLYLSRFLRVVPMYLVLLVLVLLTVGVVTRFHWQEPPGAVLKEIGRWLLFKVKTVPAFNNCDDTKFMAGMVWTLAYEWLFYLALPILGLIIGTRPPPWLALASAAHVVWII